ncbi:MAG: hypothetical protein Ct9H90mP27_1790 [Gammaproteobacteria bacterium]|nr:MAG: hypothetical protein Ct9H90mP27_1790 [Gammaproteobacteria bacterium]
MIYHYFDDKKGLCEQVLKQQLRIIGNADTNLFPCCSNSIQYLFGRTSQEKNEAKVYGEEPSKMS